MPFVCFPQTLCLFVGFSSLKPSYFSLIRTSYHVFEGTLLLGQVSSLLLARIKPCFSVQDKYYQNHLGHSVMAPVGRWQNGERFSILDKKSP